MEIEVEVKNLYFIAFVAVALVVFALESYVMLKNHVVFGDSGFHARMSQWIAEHLEYPKWWEFERTKLTAIGYYRPPLFNFLVAGLLLATSGSELVIKLINPLLTLLLGVATFLLVKRLYNERVAFITSTLTITLPCLVTYSVLVYVDLLFTLSFGLFMLTFMLYQKEKKLKWLLLSGIFGSISILTKIPGLAAVLFLAIHAAYALFFERRKFDLKVYIIPLLLITAIALPLFVRNLLVYGNPVCKSILFFSSKGCSLREYSFEHSFAGRTTKAGTEQDILAMGVTNYLEFAYGLLWFVPLAFVAGLLLLKDELKQKHNIALLLMILTLLAYVAIAWKSITTRAENAPRYMLGWTVAIALVASLWLDEVAKAIQKKFKYGNLLVLGLIVLLSFYFNFLPKLWTMDAVKHFSSYFFEACDWIKQNLPRNALLMSVWDHRTVYNAQRNCTPNVPDIVLEKNATKIVSVAKKLGITHFFVQKFSVDPGNHHYREKYDLSFIITLENNPKAFKKVFENGPSLVDCLTGKAVCDGTLIYEVNYSYAP